MSEALAHEQASWQTRCERMKAAVNHHGNLRPENTMKRWLPFLALTLLLPIGCASSTQPAPQAAVDPGTEPTAIGAIDEAARQAGIEGEEGAARGRRIGKVVGVFAAIFGGPQYDSVDGIIDRYRISRDIGETIGGAIGTSRGAAHGAARGLEMDKQFAELLKVDGIEVGRPYPDLIEIHMASSPGLGALESIAAVFAGREERAVEIEASGNSAMNLRESFIALGMPGSSLTTRCNDDLVGVIVRITYRD
jgi:hypothetical protein